MVVEVLVATSDAENPLCYEFFDGVVDSVGVAMVLEASGDSPKEIAQLRHLAQQENTSVTRDISAIKCDIETTLSYSLKNCGDWDTLCTQRFLLFASE